MKSSELKEFDKSFYILITGLICLAVAVLCAVALLVDYILKTDSQDKLYEKFLQAEEYNETYFSDKILPGVTVSGYDVGGKTEQEAEEFLNGCVDFNIDFSKMILEYGTETWEVDSETLPITVDVKYAVKKAMDVGRKGEAKERKDALERLARGEKIDVSATVIKDSDGIKAKLKEIKKEIDIEKQNAQVSFRFTDKPEYIYTDEKAGQSLDIVKVYSDICELVKEPKSVLEYELKPETVEPDIKRSDLEGEYQLVTKFATKLSVRAKEGRIHNIRTALAKLDERVWLPGETFSFNEWVGERTVEAGYMEGVFIVAGEYDTTIGGGICQVSTTMYYTALLTGANAIGTNAPIEIVERRPHTWPSEYIAAGLDATVSWPHTDLKMYNNNSTPYFIHTYMNKSGSYYYVTFEFYGKPLPNNATVRIETEQVEELPAPQEILVDTENKYNLALGERKQTRQGRNGYKINVYQIWSEPGKEDVKSLVTVSVYNPVSEQIYVSAETKAQMDAAPTAAPTQ